MATLSLRNLVSAAVLVTASSTALAGTTVITFDEDTIAGNVVALQHGTVISDQYSDLGVSISVNNKASNNNFGVLYDSTPGTAKGNDRDPDLTGPSWGNSNFDASNYSAGNTLIIQENNDGCDDLVCDKPDDQVGRSSDGLAGFVTFKLDFEITELGFDLIDFQQDLRVEEVGRSRVFVYNQAMERQVFKFSDFASAPNSAMYGENSINQIYLNSFNIAGVNKVKFKIYGTGAIDNVRLTNTSTAVPEPATMAMFTLGLLGLRRFNRKKS